MLGRLNRRLEDTGIRVSIPSQRLDSFGVDMAESVAGEKKGGLTFAPEAGSQRMRDIINKNVTEEDLDRAAKAVLRGRLEPHEALLYDGPSRRARRGHRGHRQSGRSRAGARSFRGAQGSSRLDLGVDLGFGLYPKLPRRSSGARSSTTTTSSVARSCSSRAFATVPSAFITTMPRPRSSRPRCPAPVVT